MAVISGVGVRRYYERFGYRTLKDYQARKAAALVVVVVVFVAVFWLLLLRCCRCYRLGFNNPVIVQQSPMLLLYDSYAYRFPPF